MFLAHLLTVAQILSVAITVAGAVFVAPVFRSKLALVRERDMAVAHATTLERTIAALGGGSEGLVAIVAALREEVRELKLEVGEVRRTYVAGIRYIAALIRHIRSRKPASEMPDPPPEISDAVLAELRSRESDVAHAPA